MDKKNKGIDFEKVAEAYWKNPTIEEYVRLRKITPGTTYGISTEGGLEFAFSQAEALRSAGVEPKMVVAALGGGDCEQSQLAMHLLEKLVERNSMKGKGETHVVSRKKGISDSLVNHLVVLMLDAADANEGGHICPDLMVLIKHQLCGGESEFEIQQRVNEKRKEAVWIAAQLVAIGEEPSLRKVAGVLGVQASTVKRWFPENQMTSEAKKLAASIKNLRVLAKKKPVAG